MGKIRSGMNLLLSKTVMLILITYSQVVSIRENVVILIYKTKQPR